ncbi:hypothetical protein BH10PSE17_BH10PSE17_09590 [soil metagenome]
MASSIVTPAPETPNLAFAIVDVFVAALAALGWWFTFSGPFRWAIDLQLAHFGDYSESLTALGVGIAIYFPIWFCESVVRRVFSEWVPELSLSWCFGAVFVVAMFAGTAFGLYQAWDLWEPEHPVPSTRDPLQVVDLDQLGDSPLPTGHVRLIGLVDRSRQAVFHFTGRRGLGGHSESWQPVVARLAYDPHAPVLIVATRHGSFDDEVAPGVPDSPEGMLSVSDIDTSTIYEMKRRGINLAARSYTFNWPGNPHGTSLDTRWVSVLIVLGLLGCWGAGAYNTMKQNRSQTRAPASAPAPLPVASVAAPAADLDPVTGAEAPADDAAVAPWLSKLSLRAVLGGSMVILVLATIAWLYVMDWLYQVAGGLMIAGSIAWWVFDKLTGDRKR